jgi:hypothetical protein
VGLLVSTAQVRDVVEVCGPVLLALGTDRVPAAALVGEVLVAPGAVVHLVAVPDRCGSVADQQGVHHVHDVIALEVATVAEREVTARVDHEPLDELLRVLGLDLDAALVLARDGTRQAQEGERLTSQAQRVVSVRNELEQGQHDERADWRRRCGLGHALVEGGAHVVLVVELLRLESLDDLAGLEPGVVGLTLATQGANVRHLGLGGRSVGPVDPPGGGAGVPVVWHGWSLSLVVRWVVRGV